MNEELFVNLTILILNNIMDLWFAGIDFLELLAFLYIFDLNKKYRK